MNPHKAEAERRDGGVGGEFGERPRSGLRPKRELPLAWSRLTQQVIASAIEVHSHLGPGRLERSYEHALCIEFELRGIRFERQRVFACQYKGQPIGDLQLDLVVESLIVVELKAVEQVGPVHLAQLVSYLRAADLPLGLLINFNQALLVDGLSRRLNPQCSLVRSLPEVQPARTGFESVDRSQSSDPSQSSAFGMEHES